MPGARGNCATSSPGILFSASNENLFRKIVKLFLQVIEEMGLNLFWIIFFSITTLIAGIAFISVNIKKLIETLKELKIQQQVTVMPISNKENDENSSQRSEIAQAMECLGLKFNNAKYNDPMFTGKEEIH